MTFKAQMTWYHIDSAPKDGSLILAGCVETKNYAVVRWTGGGWYLQNDGIDDAPITGLTHWTPIDLLK